MREPDGYEMLMMLTKVMKTDQFQITLVGWTMYMNAPVVVKCQFILDRSIGGI